MKTDNYVKTLIIDIRMCSESKNTLLDLGYKLIEIPEISCFELPICAHPDIHVFKFSKLYVSTYVKELFTFFNFTEVGREQKCDALITYPDNVALNCAVVGNRIICNKKYVLPEILNEAQKNNYEIINVNQGYAKCSVCVINDNAIITEDDGIEKTCVNAGIDVLKLNKGYVVLDGYDYGFIGGASGLIERDIVAFNGNIDLHPEGDKIKEFCKKHGVSVICLCNKPLYDAGSIYRL